VGTSTRGHCASCPLCVDAYFLRPLVHGMLYNVPPSPSPNCPPWQLPGLPLCQRRYAERGKSEVRGSIRRPRGTSCPRGRVFARDSSPEHSFPPFPCSPPTIAFRWRSYLHLHACAHPPLRARPHLTHPASRPPCLPSTRASAPRGAARASRPPGGPHGKARHAPVAQLRARAAPAAPRWRSLFVSGTPWCHGSFV
jgi:hypothetical protein